jgi:hypothetical protein
VPPTLSIIADGANMVLTWPDVPTGFTTGYTLESTTNLVPPVVWQTNSTAPIVIGGQNVVTNLVNGTEMFFQLFSPLPYKQESPGKKQTYATSAKTGAPSAISARIHSIFKRAEAVLGAPVQFPPLWQRSRFMKNQTTTHWTSFFKLNCPFHPGISHWLMMGKHAHRFETKNRPSGHNNKNKVKE